MKQQFVDDYIDGILSSWYTRAALSGPTRLALAPRCEFCHHSPLAEVIDLTFWPHDLVHHLVLTVAAAVDCVTASIVEETAVPTAPTAVRRESAIARSMVTASLARRANDMVDVLENCVHYTLDDSGYSATVARSV